MRGSENHQSESYGVGDAVLRNRPFVLLCPHWVSLPDSDIDPCSFLQGLALSCLFISSSENIA